jgi:hypothetical protein
MKQILKPEKDLTVLNSNEPIKSDSLMNIPAPERAGYHFATPLTLPALLGIIF